MATLIFWATIIGAVAMWGERSLMWAWGTIILIAIIVTLTYGG